MSNHDLPPLPDDVASLLGQERAGAFDPGTAARREVWSKLSHSLHLAPTPGPAAPAAPVPHGAGTILGGLLAKKTAAVLALTLAGSGAGVATWRAHEAARARGASHGTTPHRAPDAHGAPRTHAADARFERPVGATTAPGESGVGEPVVPAGGPTGAAAGSPLGVSVLGSPLGMSPVASTPVTAGGAAAAAPSTRARTAVEGAVAARTDERAARVTSPDEVEHDAEMEAEQQALTAVQSAIDRHDAALALRLLAEHRHRRGNVELTQERDALEVRALAAAGRMVEARTRATRFLRAHPQSIYRRAIEESVQVRP